MIEVASCVVCDGAIRTVRQAVVAPFLGTRIWQKPPFAIHLVQCEKCGFLFYNPRLDADEERLLYTNYRSHEYQQMRHNSEPWYTPAFNADLASPASYEVRRAIVAAILREHVGTPQVRRVLDYGGDRGDLVLGLVDGAAAFVYDISSVAPAEGVTATTEPAACRADLIVNSNVLEHIGFPRRLVNEILDAAPSGGRVFLEVPCESPFGLKRIVRRIAQIFIMAIKQPALALSIARPASLYMMHEHINYFNDQSLSALMRSCGCAVTAAGRYAVNGRAGKGDMAWCLGTKA